MARLDRVILLFIATLSITLSSAQNTDFEKKINKQNLTKDSLWGFSSHGREVFDVITSNGDTIQLVDVDGLAYSGDMIIGYTKLLKQYGLKISSGEIFPENHQLGTQGAIIYPSSGYTWPGGLVPYTFASNLTEKAKQDMLYAIDHWNSRTNLQFVPRTNQRDYISIRDGGGCSSWIGKQGGMQRVTLARGCGRGAAVHELGHAVGFFHEQSRTDRDNYVFIYWENIRDDMVFNFEKMSTNDGKNHGAYDFRSIMHYRSDSFGINGATTIWPKSSDVDTDYMGRGSKLSIGDIAAAESIYGPGTPPPEASIELSKETYTENESVIAMFNGTSGGVYDWIGLYRKGAPNDDYISWQYLDGAEQGSREFSSLSTGNYEARLFFNDSYDLEASANFSVESETQTNPTVTTEKAVYSSSDNIVIRFRNASGNEYDWIGLYRKSTGNAEYISWRYLRQRNNGTVRFPSLPEGSYSARLFFNDSYTLEAEGEFSVSDE